jgi:hypothetical protein
MSEKNFMGERGDHGERGVAGERGPKGDHGQHGEIGATGAQGATGDPGQGWHWGWWSALRTLAFVLVAIAAIAAFRDADDAAETAQRTANTANNAARSANIAAQDAKRALNASERQRTEARDQVCQGDEREHLRDVNGVKNVYKYLESLKPADYRDSINLAIIRSVSERELEANQDTAPKFCDEPGLGLPEPDPKLPERSDKIKMLIKLERQHLAGE